MTLSKVSFSEFLRYDYLDHFDTFGENFDFDTFKNDTFKSVWVDRHPRCITTDTGGIQFTSSIETQNIRSGPGNSLTVSSPVGKLKLNGPQKVDFSSFAGPINLFGLEDITLKTKGQGKVST